MENEWVAYEKKCPECEGPMLKKTNKKGGMATVKHATPNPDCSLKMWSVKDGGKKGTQRTEEEGGKKGGKQGSGENPPAPPNGGTPAGKGGGTKGGKSGSDSKPDGEDEDDDNKPAPKESYGDSLKRIYG